MDTHDTEDRHDVLIGQTLGKYRIVRMLGKGGMSTVYEAVQEGIKRTVAVKVLPRSLMHDDTFMVRFQREAEIIAGLEHFHILPIYDYGEADGTPYIVIRYLEGGSVQDRLEEGPLSLSDVSRMIRQTASALDYAHARGVVHRDIKPSNILLDRDGNAYLSDFGIAKVVVDTGKVTGTGVLGTPAYMAPEQAQSDMPTPAADIYALGVTLFKMLTGSLPFNAETPVAQILMHIQDPVPSVKEINPDLSVQFDVVIQRAMAKDPSHRYATAGDFARALDRVIGRTRDGEALAEEAEEYPTGTLQLPRAKRAAARTHETLVDDGLASPPTRRWWLWIGGAAGALAVIAVIGGFALGGFGGGGGAAITPTAMGEGVAMVPPTETASPTATVPPTATATETPSPTSLPTETPTPTATLSPTPLPGQLTLHGVPMVLIPSGRFVMGRNEGYPRERPAHEVTLSDYYIDQTEVTNLYYMECIDAGACPEPEFTFLPTLAVYWGHEAFYNHPVVYVSWDVAEAYCAWRGGHLPTEAQWEKAARWDVAARESRQFPWTPPVLDGYYLNYANELSYPAAVGSYPAGASPYGLMDMAGNVAEWVGDWYQDNYYELAPSVDPPGPERGEFRTVRGGSYDSQGNAVTATARDYLRPATKLPTLGFRCAWAP